MSVADTFRLVLAPPHPAGRPFILGGIVAFVLGIAFAGWLLWLGLLFTLFCLYFFRDPERVPPGRVGALVAPADGKVVSVAPPCRRPSSGSAPCRAGASRSFSRSSTCT